MSKLLAAIYGELISPGRAFFSGATRAVSIDRRLSLSIYIDHVQERSTRMRTSPSAAFLQGAHHFESAESMSDELAVAK